MKIAMLLSGGVDSSVALRLLLDQGHDVTAFYIKVWLEEEFAGLGDCPWEEDVSYARAVCDQLDVPLKIIPLQAEYFERIVSYAVAELKAGRTPSPDVYCNRRIKFGAFLETIGDDYERVATGHYARVEERDGRAHLMRAPDPVKDQTYFLCMLLQDQVKRIIFPLGEYVKSEVRDMAQTFDLPTKSRKDSQGICFLGKVRYRDFVRANLGEQPGPLINAETGLTLGQHPGYWFYTIGQREGIGLHGGPWYVTRKDIATNTIFISNTKAASDQARSEFRVDDLSWITDAPDVSDLLIKIRHSPAMDPCTITPDNDGLTVTLAKAERAIAPGQFAAFYQGDECLGGGVIQ